MNKIQVFTKQYSARGNRLAAALLVALILTYSPARVQARSQTMEPGGAPTTPVTIDNFAFSPSVVVIQAGTSVTWTNNQSLVIHTSTSDSGVWDSGDLLTGQSFTQTFNTPGRYDYHCMHHPLTMVGTVIVVKPQLFLPDMLNLN